MHFKDLNLIEPLLRAVNAEGYDTPTPIQSQAIPHVLQGKDLIGCAQTGTGKTAAFALPILQRLVETRSGVRRGTLRALILSPTRELASQIKESFDTYGRHTGLKSVVIFGGVGQQPQVDAVRRGTDILVATPGRLLDLMQQGEIRFNTLEIFVLDEADRMLDMGFIHDVRRVIKALPTKRQTLLFSATMPQDIQDLADRILINPVRVEVTPQSTTVELIQQSVYLVEKADKPALLEHILQRDHSIRRVLVFTRTKHGADRVAKRLYQARIDAAAIHGDKSQGARERALANFKSGKTRVLVATDIAARGIDVEDVTHVINFDLPNIPESYVHRIGRTARAGASGIAYSFCDLEERKYLADIEKTIRLRVPIVENHPYESEFEMVVAPPNGQKGRGNSNGSSRGEQRGQQQRQQNGQQNGQQNNTSGTARTPNGGSTSNRNANSGRPATAQPQRTADTPRSADAQRPANAQQAADSGGEAPKRRRRRRGGRGRNGQNQSTSSTPRDNFRQ